MDCNVNSIYTSSVIYDYKESQMIWGKTFEEKKQKYDQKTICFAWLPIRLKNRRWVWLAKVRRKYSHCTYLESFEYYELEDPNAKIG